MSQAISTTQNPLSENPKNRMGYTPPGVSDFLHRTISLVLHPRRILDPSIGRGALTAPWSARSNAYIIGIDVDPASQSYADSFICTKFEDVSVWNLPIPDLVLCNPPVNDAPKRGLYPEIFLRKMVELFGTEIPIALFVPIYFRLGLRINSERRRWLLDKQMEIMSIISLPLDIFPDAISHDEILLFNIQGLKPHYFLDEKACLDSDLKLIQDINRRSNHPKIKDLNVKETNHGRTHIGIEQNSAYSQMAQDRLMEGSHDQDGREGVSMSQAFQETIYSSNEVMNHVVNHAKPKVGIERLPGTLLCQADNMDLMKTLPDNSNSSGVFDPPYGISFMGKEWDSFSDGIQYQRWCTKWAKELFRVLKPGAFFLSFSSPRLYHHLACGVEDAGFIVRDQLMWMYGTGLPKSRNVSNDIDRIVGKQSRAIGSEAWKGWGTALKPAYEPIILAQKPKSETSIAKNVLKWGTGALNIDACRIGSSGGTRATGIIKGDQSRKVFGGGISNIVKVSQIDSGRFPSNMIIGEDVAPDLGKKSRFFYCPKASTKEKEAGCEFLEARIVNSEGNGRTYNDHCAVCGKKFVGSDSTRCHCPKGVKKTDKSKFTSCNHHPTVKPIALMEYLVKLVTPKDGICLDIFMGSGSTGIACANLGFAFIGVEMEPSYFEIAKARIQHWQSKSINRSVQIPLSHTQI